jgi:hypothetical protein
MIIETLGLPKLVFPVITVTVGYPDEKPEQTDRLPYEAIVHSERYSDYTPSDIDRIYAEKEALPSSAAFIAENGKKTLAQVFTDVRYTKEANEIMSDNLLKVLSAQGFINNK